MSKTLIDSYIKDIAKRIYDPVLNGAASVMVGAGFSKNADLVDDDISAPNWEELAMSMFDDLYKKPSSESDIRKWEVLKIKKTSGKNVLKLAEEYKAVFGRNKLNKFIESNINDDKYIPGELHKKLLSLNWRDVFTTNYDTLLERSIDKIDTKLNYKILTNQNDLPGSIQPRIIKLHGSVDNAKHYIICEEDYRTYPVYYAPFVNTVQQAMLETQLCLIGFSGDDPNFLSWLGWLRDNMGENCPTIYLVGLFKDMSYSEKMTLENQNIKVLDLGDMFDNKYDVGHREALDTFLNKLSEYGKEEEKIFDSVPYRDSIFSWDFYKSIDNKYFKVMDMFLFNMKEKTKGYVAFQNDKETNYFIDDINEHFKNLLQLEPDIVQVDILSKIVYLLRKGYTFLEDGEANRLSQLIFSIEREKLQNDMLFLASWVDISIYLLEMYRIDGRNDDYQELLMKVEKESVQLGGYTKEELIIEKCKFFISSFDYIKAKNEIEKIKHEVSLDIHLKKIFLYIQIGNYEKGKDLLRKASAILAQKKYSDNRTASLKGYLNLCAIALREWNDDSFSDEDCYSNSYNVRNIYNKIKNDVTSSLLLVNNESRDERPSFNPCSYIVSRGTTSKEKNAIIQPFKYIMFQDLLCLPNTFVDHKEILAMALNGIIKTSKNPIWKWSSIIRTNDLNIIDSFFKRELIISSERESIEIISSQLFELIASFNKKDNFDIMIRIVNQEVIYDILSRFSIMMQDNKVIVLIRNIIEIIENLDVNNSRKFIGLFRRVRFAINANILLSFFKYLLSSDKIPLWCIFELIRMGICVKLEQISDDIFNKIIDGIKSDDSIIRDIGIAKVMLIESIANTKEHKDDVASAIWGRVNHMGFPEVVELYEFSIWDWRILPYPENVNIENLYIKYLENPQFIKSVNGKSISLKDTNDASININDYINCFRMVSYFRKSGKNSFDFNLDSNYFINTIKYIYQYIDNEKLALNIKFDIFDSKIETTNIFIRLSNFVAMLITQAYLSNEYTEEVATEFQIFNDLIHEIDVDSIAIEITGKIISQKNIEVEIESLINRAIIGDRNELDQVIHAIEILLTFEKFAINDIKISDKVIELVKSIKYFDISRSSMLIARLISIIDHEVIVQDKYKNDIIKVFKDNKDKLNIAFNKSDRALLDTIYSFSALIKRYYDSLIENDISIPESLAVIIEEFKQSELKEVKYMWEDFSFNSID
ncbi:MAG: SIR2 family NAD-dependent protein deacylase [Proteocatella sp.]